MNIVCEVCGNIGFKHLLISCRDCKCSAAHQYCLDKVVFDASLADWLCYECLQRHGEVTYNGSLEKVSSERPPSYAHFGSMVHQPITKRVELARDAKPYRNNMEMGGNFSSKHIDHDNQTNEHASAVCNNTDKVMTYLPNDGCERVINSDGIKSTPSNRERNMNSLDISSISQHDNAESSESSETFTECQKGSSYHHRKTVKTAAKFSSSQESGEYIPSESKSLEPDNLPAHPGADYFLSRTSYMSEAQKERVIAFIQKTKPAITVFVAVMRKSNVQPPGPCLGISKEYALAHFPQKSTNVTLQRPGKSKKWHPIFYKRNESRKNMLMGQWLDFVRDNHVQEGDICLLAPEKGEGQSMFTVYILRATATQSRYGAGVQSVGPCPGRSVAKMASASEVPMEKPTGEHVFSESGMHESSHGSLVCEVSGSPSQTTYIVPCRSRLSKSQKRIVEERVRAIQSEVPICVAVMKNNNVGIAQRWMLELGSHYASVYLPARGQTVVLQCGRKVWETKMMYHTGRRWTLNGGWPKFARDNGLRVGDICLFELKKNERKLTMRVHIIPREQF